MPIKAEPLYKAALEKWGVEPQLRQAQEECGELIAALNQYIRKTRYAEHVISEIADVKIMIEQLELIFGADAVAAERIRKLARLQDRMNPVYIVPKAGTSCGCGKVLKHQKAEACV